MFHNIKGKKHGLKFVIKGKKVFLCDTNLDYVNVKIYRTTALAESFNANVKLFRANLRGVADKKFFLFRIAKLYAYPH